MVLKGSFNSSEVQKSRGGQTFLIDRDRQKDSVNTIPPF